MQNRGRLLQKAGLFLGLLIFLMGAAPAVFSIVQAGGIALMLYGICLFSTCFFWDKISGNPLQIKRRFYFVGVQRASSVPCWWRRLRMILCIFLAASGFFGAVLSVKMVSAGWFTPPAEDATVVVLGCQVVDGKPSKMLRLRLEKALEWLNTHPDAKVVCSGGVDAREQISEGMAMKNWLMEKGISEDRIFVEGTSRSTLENIAFSAKIIQENGLSRQIAIASDGFHQMRAHLYAKHEGLTAGALPSVTPWGLLPSYWVREWLGIAKAMVCDL